MKTIAFFNNKGGVGKTTLVNHLAWMFRELGLRIVLLDLDPQANLTTSFLDDMEIEPLLESDPPRTILGAVRPLLDRLGDVTDPHVCDIAPGLWLVAGDPGLSDFEDRLSDAWTHCLDDNKANRADGQRVVTAFHRIADRVACSRQADLVLLDLGPALSPLDRSALVASDCVVVPVGADLFSLRGLINLGPRLCEWRAGWNKRGGGTTCHRERWTRSAMPSCRMRRGTTDQPAPTTIGRRGCRMPSRATSRARAIRLHAPPRTTRTASRPCATT